MQTVATLAGKNPKQARCQKVPILGNSFRSRIIKKTLISKKNFQTEKSIPARQMSLSKFSRFQPGKGKLKNISNKSPTHFPTQQHNVAMFKSVILPNKKKMETNLYVDASSLSYLQIKELINLEIEKNVKKDFDLRSAFFKIKVRIL